jgi:clan AA aspartic protease
MLKGQVNRHGEPVISIQLILRNRPANFTAVIDTGFNGYLSVPRRLLVRSKWLAIGTEKFEIATGALVEQEIYLGEIIFDRQRGPVYSVATEAQDILIGTKLLRGKTLMVNFRTKQVTVR